MNPRIKICCIASVAEAQMAIRHGASAVGLVARMPSGPGPIADERIAEIAQAVPPPIATFLLTCETRPDDIAAHHRRVLTNTIQIVDALQNEAYHDLRRQVPGVKIVQVIHVLDEKSVEEAVRISQEVDALLLDSGNPHLQVKELGGTGRTHDWSFSRKIVEQSRVPVFLAGGLNAANVRAAIDAVQPYGLDLCSGVRTNPNGGAGHLDEAKLEAFFRAAWG